MFILSMSKVNPTMTNMNHILLNTSVVVNWPNLELRFEQVAMFTPGYMQVH